jgi:NADH:ubiquinone reductase (H+-translocating)
VLTDGALRSVSHPGVLAVGDAGHTPGPDGDRYSMSCQFAFPSGAYAADQLVSEALGESPRDDGPATGFDLGFTARCVSLGRRAAVLQLTDKDDAAADRSTITGRAAVALKRVQFAGISSAVSMERRMPGMVRWPKAHRVAAHNEEAVAR